MRPNKLPDFVQDKLDVLAKAVAELSDRVERMETGIPAARTRPTGTFRTLAEEEDLQASLKRMIADLPVLQQKLSDAESVLARAKNFIAALPDDVTLEPVKVTTNGGGNFADLKWRIQRAQEETRMLSSVPVPSSDIEARVRAYVQSLARPKISGIRDGEKLEVIWPESGVLPVLALLLGEAMEKALLREVERVANAPMPLEGRKARIAELKLEIDRLQRAAYALNADMLRDLPAEVILGCRVVRREAVSREERVSPA